MTPDRIDDLTREDVEQLQEICLVPAGARVVYSDATGTWEGCGFDNLDKSASSNRYFEGPLSFIEVVRWYRQQLGLLGWPPDLPMNAADGTRWHHWQLGLESIDLIDRGRPADEALGWVGAKGRGQRLQPEVPARGSGWSVTYKRRPPETAEIDGDGPQLWTPGANGGGTS